MGACDHGGVPRPDRNCMRRTCSAMLRQLADDGVRGHVHALAAVVEALERPPAEPLGPRRAVVAKVRDEVRVKAADGGNAPPLCPLCRFRGHGRGAHQVHQVRPPRLYFAQHGAAERAADAVVGIQGKADEGHSAHAAAPRDLRPRDERGVDAKVDAVALQEPEELRQRARHAVHVGKQALREVDDLHARAGCRACAAGCTEFAAGDEKDWRGAQSKPRPGCRKRAGGWMRMRCWINAARARPPGRRCDFGRVRAVRRAERMNSPQRRHEVHLRGLEADGCRRVPATWTL